LMSGAQLQGGMDIAMPAKHAVEILEIRAKQ